MTKRVTNRAYKKRFGYKPKRLDTSVKTPFQKFKDSIKMSIFDVGFKLNTIKENIKSKFPTFKKEKIVRGKNLNDVITSFAVRENISLALATVIFLNCIASIATKTYAAESKSHDSVSIEQIDEILESHSLQVEELTKTFLRESSEIADLTDAYIDEYQFKKAEEMYKQHIEEICEDLIEPVELSNEEKIAIILDKYNITEYQLLVIAAIAMLEGGENYYEECYNVISVLFNRITSSSCITYVSSLMGKGTGVNIYNQAMCPGQFTVSRTKVYKLVEGNITSYKGFQAVIDMLYSGVPSHNYYRFCDPYLNYKYNGIQLVPRGNCYFAPVGEKDKVDPALTLPNYAKYVEQEIAEDEVEEELDSSKRDKILSLDKKR